MGRKAKDESVAQQKEDVREKEPEVERGESQFTYMYMILPAVH